MKITEKQIYVGVGVLGVLVVSGVLYKSLTANQGYNKLTGEKNTPITSPQPQYNAPQYVAQANNSSSDTWKIQQALKDAGYDISVDGKWGNQTETIFKQWRNDIGKGGSTYNSWTSGQWVDYLNKEKISYGGGGVSQTSSSSSKPNFDTMDNNQLITYIKNQGLKTKTDLGGWYNSALKEWAKAIYNGEAQFYCSQCFYAGKYNTSTGLKV